MINKKLLKKLLQSYSLETIEEYLISCYIITKKLPAQNSPILGKVVENHQNNKTLSGILAYNKLKIESLKNLESYLELLIPKKDRKLNGAFFTPTYVVDYIINATKPQPSEKCLDPACGSGAFLLGLANYYLSNFRQSIQQTVQKNIFGSDILDYNIKRAKILLSLLALENDEYLEETDFNLHHQDSLRSDWPHKFDIILGNPPYVKYQDLSDENRAFLLQKWTTAQSGTFNLYFAFFELGYQLLSEKGRLAYITPNNYFTSLAGKSLRSFFTNNQCAYQIVDFSHKKVFDAQTYTAITFLNKQKNNSILYDRIAAEQLPHQFVEKTGGSPNYWTDLKVKKWRLLKTKERKNINLIENTGIPIKQLFNICVGIATLKDTVFFVDSSRSDEEYIYKTLDNQVFKIEKASTKAVYKISDFKSQKEVDSNKRRIIFPYTIIGKKARPIPETTFKQRFPECYTYLLAQRERLKERDKGKIQYSPFFVWGRTQGLTKRGKKILTPTFSQFPRFLLVEEEDAFFTNGYGIYFKETNTTNLFSKPSHLIALEKNIDVAQKILNSRVMHYYVSKTSVSIAGGYPCYQKNFIEKFTIPELTEKEVCLLRNLDDKLDIDNFLVKKYELTLN